MLSQRNIANSAPSSSVLPFAGSVDLLEDRLIAQAKDAFFKQLVSTGRSPKTLANYREAIDQFLGFYLAQDPTRTLDGVRSADIEDFLIHLRSLRRKDSTVQNRYRSLRRFFRWLKAQRLIKKNPVQGVPQPVARPHAVVPYTLEEVRAMMEASRRWPPLALRDQVIIALLYNTGMRAGELCTLRPEHVQEGAVLVTGKGKKERWLSLEPITQELLATYMSTRPPRRYVFNLSVTGLHQMIKRLAWAATVPNAYVHRMRDTFAVEFLENGGGVDDLQVILGHANIQTTLRYVMYGRERRAGVQMRKFAPFAKRLTA